ncbi:RpiB/LacA/LacB family sugar-phosphate isomerase [Cuneatibacter sp. NSJ-177]|uniref:RpiB/LacA/LacB family sugar-phosphate isomerase n=1 Tax=Cuneatibacter sp. NSJ-177 TaxID=2931401 RepID=UPI001FD4CD74|nr:RpiB/LacA/LacB family sugar-phosphate isomerase [Cuneatibacter sp. NSJ-177]MCJ7834829.1 RpiB/LacA/LacB family sugar-phosphate isomerase [Cuneatibacter sp. NSJ-177]
MKIALLVEGSTSHHAKDIWEVLSGYEAHECYQVGMRGEEGEESLTFLHTSLLAGILLNTKAVDFVIGGCGTGQGFLNGVMAFPGVLCGLVYDPLEAWLFMQVNAGNCLSLPFNRGWGLAGKEQIRLILDQAFSVPVGGGYPPERADLIRRMHRKLRSQSDSFRKSFLEILPLIDRDLLLPALGMKGVRELMESAPESPEKAAVIEIYDQEGKR